MWAKILVGALAAVAVAGVGIYVALPPSSGGCGSCGGSKAVNSLADNNAPGCCPVSAGCDVPTVNTDALAACTGGYAIKAETDRAMTAPSCCGE